MENLDHDKEKLRGTHEVFLLLLLHICVCVYYLTYRNHFIISSTAFHRRYCSLAEYYAARTPQSFRKVCTVCSSCVKYSNRTKM